MDTPRIIVVGGGAGGLELATRLGKKLGKRKQAEVLLIDVKATHIWKPLLHEVAAGTFDSHENEIEYLAQAAHNHFRFRLGKVTGVDRGAKTVTVAPTLNDDGEELIPERAIAYDYLVMSVGSVSHDFGVEGVRDHCLFLDTTDQAERFQRRLIESYIRVQGHAGEDESGQLDVAIVGAGATGVELAAQLHEVSHLMNAYGLDNVRPADIRMTLIEAADRILPGVTPRVSAATHKQLEKLGINILTAETVTRVTDEGIETKSGKFVRAPIRVWAAGVKAPPFLKDFGELPANRIGQLEVRQTLQTVDDDDIYAIGDCASCPWPGHERNVPPRAQSAHQMASTAAKSIEQRVRGKSGDLPTFQYHDYGSLVSLGKYSTVGNLMGNLMGTVTLEGFIARMVYLSLYKMHQVALFGVAKTSLLTLSHFFRRSVHPKIKLH